MNNNIGVDKICIHNFKSIKELNDFRLSKINILIGPNGSGKSNFISFFKFIRKIYEQNLQFYVAQNGGADKFLYNGIKHSKSIYGKIVFNNNPWENFYKFTLDLSTDNNFIFSTEYSGHSRDEKKINNGGERESTIKLSDAFRNKYLSSFLESIRIFHFHDTSFTSKMRFPAPFSDNAFLQEDGSNLPVILFNIKNHYPEFYDTLLYQIKSNLPYLKDFYLEPDNHTNQISIRWSLINEDTIFDAHQLSDGSLRYIALCTLLMQPEPPPIIIIDEPELGLHPYAINQVAQMINMASEKSQIIISTQSSDLIEALIANASEPESAVENIIITEFQNNQTKFRRLNLEELKHWLDSYSLRELWHKNILGGQP